MLEPKGTVRWSLAHLKKDKLKICLVAFEALKAPISQNEEKTEFCCRLSVLAIGTQALYCCFLVRNVYSAGKSAC